MCKRLPIKCVSFSFNFPMFPYCSLLLWSVINSSYFCRQKCVMKRRTDKGVVNTNKTELQTKWDLCPPFYNLSFLNTLCTFIVWNKKLSSPSFADLFLGQRKVKQTLFSQINTIIDWTPIRAIIEVAYTKGYKSTGRPSYDSLVLFKIELLRTWYGLSDGEVEDQVNDRLSFSCFAGLGMEDIVPDSTTVTQKPVG